MPRAFPTPHPLTRRLSVPGPLTSSPSIHSPPRPMPSSPAHHPLLPGIFQARSPSPGGEKLIGGIAGLWEKGQIPLGFLRGVGAGRVGVSQGLDAWVLSRKLSSWSGPPWAPPIPVDFLQFSFPTQSACLGPLLPQGRTERLGKASLAAIVVGCGWGSKWEKVSWPSQETQ